MTEQYSEKTVLDPSILGLLNRDAYRARINDHFFSGQPPFVGTSEAKKEDYVNGLVLTNNLRKYINNDPFTAVIMNSPDQDDPVRVRMGQIIEQLKNDAPDLWQRGMDAVAAGYVAINEEAAYLDAVLMRRAGDPMPERPSKADSLKREAVLTELFDALAPRLDSANIDPLMACI